jgi:hypothetical protein
VALGSTQPLTEISTRNLLRGKGRPARKADIISAVSRLFRKCGSFDVSQPYEPPSCYRYSSTFTLPLISQTWIFRRIHFTTPNVARRQMHGLIHDELMEELWPSSKYYPDIRPGRLRRTMKNLPHQWVSRQRFEPQISRINVTRATVWANSLANIPSFLPYYGGLVLITKFRWWLTQSYNTVSHIATKCIYGVAETGLQQNMATRAQ